MRQVRQKRSVKVGKIKNNYAFQKPAYCADSCSEVIESFHRYCLIWLNELGFFLVKHLTDLKSVFSVYSIVSDKQNFSKA